MLPNIEVEPQDDSVVLTITPFDSVIMATCGTYPDGDNRFAVDVIFGGMPAPESDQEKEGAIEVMTSLIASAIRTASSLINCPPDALLDRISNDLFAGKLVI